MKRQVILHAKQAIGPCLKAAFDQYRFRVRVWTTGHPSGVFRGGSPPEGVAVEEVVGFDASSEHISGSSP